MYQMLQVKQDWPSVGISFHQTACEQQSLSKWQLWSFDKVTGVDSCAGADIAPLIRVALDACVCREKSCVYCHCREINLVHIAAAAAAAMCKR